MVLERDVLKLGDWENFLKDIPNETFDLIYQDPPYEMNYLSQIPGSNQWNKSGVSKSKFSSPIVGDFKGGVNWEKLAKECFRLLKLNTFLFLHCNLDIIINNLQYFQKAGFNIKGCVVWNKRFSIGGDLKASMQKPWEPLIYMAKGVPEFNSIKILRKAKINKNNGRVIKVEKEGFWEDVERERITELEDWIFPLLKTEKIGFPTQKPLELCKQVISLTTKKGDFVLDPFCGSGSIILAAKLLGRNYYSCEIDEKAYQLTKRRIFEQERE